MSLITKFRTCFITFILLVSSFSFLFINTDIAIAEDPFEDDWLLLFGLLGGFFDGVLSPHPYRIVGAYYVNETLNIMGDVVFDLYFSSTLLTQLRAKYRDKINVSLHHYYLDTATAKQIEKANVTITLDTDLSDDVIKKYTVELKDINHTLYEGDSLLMSIELIQSEKPISKFIGERFENKMKARIERIADYLNESEDPQLSELGGALKDILIMLEKSGIDSDDIADLANSLTSSSFYYGSTSYKSSVFIPLSNSGDNKTLYFHNLPDYTIDEFGLGSIKTTNETEPTSGTDYTWPPFFGSLVEDEEPEWMNWFLIWLFYALGEAQFELDEEIVTYYLTGENKLVLTEPDGDTARIKLSKNLTEWEGISLERNKILKNATAELYIHYPRFLTLLRKPTISVTLYDKGNNKTIATEEMQLDRTTLLEFIARGPDSPTLFTFKDVAGEEIWYDKPLSLSITANTGRFFDFRLVKLLCNSDKYPSSITLTLEETENIKLGDLEDERIIPGGTAEYILNIESEYNDTVEIDVGINDTNSPDHWSIEYPESVDVDEKGASVHVYVSSTENSSSAYTDYIDLIFNVTGKTGFDSKDSTVLVSEFAVDYEIEVIVPEDKEIKHGEDVNYKFKIRNKNTGFLMDTYDVNVNSEHDWDVNYQSEISDLENYVLNEEEYILNINVSVPRYTDITSDKLIVIITSKEAEIHDKEYSVTVDVTTAVILPNILENIYHFFESIAEDLGLDDVLGSYAAAFLLFILVFILLIFVILIVYLIKRKFIEIVCLDRIKDITPDEEAKFDITLQNPSKKTLTYEIHAEMGSGSFEVSLDNEEVVVEPKQSSIVALTVKPTDHIKADDWAEVKVSVKIVEKQKLKEISTVTAIKDGKPEVKITGVLHWPKVFKKGDRIETSFRLRNVGNVSATNINVIL